MQLSDTRTDSRFQLLDAQPDLRSIRRSRRESRSRTTSILPRPSTDLSRDTLEHDCIHTRARRIRGAEIIRRDSVGETAEP